MIAGINGKKLGPDTNYSLLFFVEVILFLRCAIYSISLFKRRNGHTCTKAYYSENSKIPALLLYLPVMSVVISMAVYLFRINYFIRTTTCFGTAWKNSCLNSRHPGIRIHLFSFKKITLVLYPWSLTCTHKKLLVLAAQNYKKYGREEGMHKVSLTACQNQEAWNPCNSLKCLFSRTPIPKPLQHVICIVGSSKLAVNMTLWQHAENDDAVVESWVVFSKVCFYMASRHLL